MNPLGWMRAPEESLAQWDGWTALAAAARADGLDRVLVCGMGGSSLAPQVVAVSAGAPATFRVLDSTHPAAVLDSERALDVPRTLFVIASKSGTTVETLSFYRYFAARAEPRQFVAITDSGTPLDTLARGRGFRAVVPHPPDVGGRYAALTAVGMLPAALLGLDGRTLLERARTLRIADAQSLGTRIADAARSGRDKLVLQPPASSRLAALPQWIEQLVAESSGKDGRGVVPIVDHQGALTADAQVAPPAAARDPLDLGLEFLRWEHATAALCERLEVNAFDQPDVEDAKRLARAELERDAAAVERIATLTPAQLARSAQPGRGDYLAVLAFLAPTEPIASQLQRLRASWSAALGVMSTVGFGPRYLHSTGQLHKGGSGTGLFLVITADIDEDAAIPETGRTFGQLLHAQARGDVRALLARGRRVAHVHLEHTDALDALRP